MSDDDSYPAAWRPAHVRKHEAEEQRLAEAQQAALDAQRLSQMTSGAGGHLGRSPLADSDAYPSSWLTTTEGLER
jgi:hypothetical protein